MRQRILVVEDSRTQAEALHALLGSNGYQVEVVTNGEEGLQRAGSTEYDLILSDILMPGLSGYELCRRIKDRPHEFGTPPVVLLTSLSEPIDILRGLECGADNFLTKPYAPDRLLARIGKILDSRASRRRRSEGDGVDFEFLGERFTVRAKREQILDLFLTGFEQLIEMNLALQESERALQRTLAQEIEARRAAEAAAAARNLILATVSHDLRNPLNTILMSAAMILDLAPRDLDPRTRERASLIRRLAHQMSRLIQDLLDVAAVEMGRLTIERSWHDAAALAREGIEMLDPLAAERGLTIVRDVPDRLPWIFADRARVLQVISNLIGNAVKFTPPGGTIVVGARGCDEHVVYSVSDTGPGIPEADLPRLFDRFWCGAHPGNLGAGLGLSIARDVVEAHGGRIWVESGAGEGATFRFSIPLAPPHEID